MNTSHLGEIVFHRIEQLGNSTSIKVQTRGRFEEIAWRDFESKVKGKTVEKVYRRESRPKL